MEIGENIKRYRKKMGLTQKGLANKIGCAEITIRQYETNKREPKFEILCTIANALSVPVGYLIDVPNIATMANNDVNVFEYICEHPEQIRCDKEVELNEFFHQLNESGKVEAIKRVEELTQIARYTEPDKKA